jgi:hypothetical protein
VGENIALEALGTAGHHAAMLRLLVLAAVLAACGPKPDPLRTDVEMFCSAATATGGKDFMSMGPYIAERMKTDLLADLFANMRTTTTLDMIIERVRGAMKKTNIERCETIDVLVKNRSQP